MAVEEYEAIRLIDLLGCTQEECAAQMGVARSTVQQVYDAARRKLALALVEGRELVVAGGSYELCPHAAGCAVSLDRTRFGEHRLRNQRLVNAGGKGFGQLFQSLRRELFGLQFNK